MSKKNIGNESGNIKIKKEHVVLPKSVKEIKKAAFLNRQSLAGITLPDGLESIGELAFDGCSNLREIILPESLKRIGRNAFYGCSSLTKIVIPEGITEIEDSTFAGCTNLRRVILPDSLEVICGRAFDGCVMLSNVLLPENVRQIGYHVFDGCSGLVKIQIPDKIRRIEEYTFSGCSSLERVRLPENLIRIGAGTFKGCKSLPEIVFPDSLVYMGADAFYGCGNLKVIKGGHRADLLYSRQYFDDGAAASLIKNNDIDIARIMDRNWKKMAVIEHAHAWLSGRAIPEEICAGYQAYLEDNRKSYYPDLLEDAELLEYMCRRKIIPAKETKELIEWASKTKKVSVSARLLEYQNQEQKKMADAFDKELEDFLFDE